MNKGFKHRIYEVLEVAHPDDRLSRVVDRSLIESVRMRKTAIPYS